MKKAFEKTSRSRRDWNIKARQSILLLHHCTAAEGIETNAFVYGKHANEALDTRIRAFYRGTSYKMHFRIMTNARNGGRRERNHTEEGTRSDIVVLFISFKKFLM